MTLNKGIAKAQHWFWDLREGRPKLSPRQRHEPIPDAHRHSSPSRHRLFFSFFLSFFLTYLLTFLLSPVRVRGYSPVKEAGWHNFTNQSGFGRIVRKIFERWTRTKLPLQHATIHHCGNILNKNLPKCHPSGLMDGHVSCEACNKYSTPNSSMDSRKRDTALKK